MKFTQDFFSPIIPLWEKYLLPRFIDKPCVALEIGSYEGMSAAWLLKNILTHPKSRITCLDIWIVDTHNGRNNDYGATFDLNMAEAGGGKVTKLSGVSNLVLRSLTDQFDFIYIDADHHAKAALSDAILCWPLLKKDGIIIFDDYNHPDYDAKTGIDAFLAIWANELDVIYKGRQVMAEKR